MYITAPLINTVSLSPKARVQQHFCGIKPNLITRVDNVEISQSAKVFNKFVDGIMAKIQDKKYAFTPEKLENIINTCKVQFPERNETEILTTIQRLTQWAEYPSLTKLTEAYPQLEGYKFLESTPTNRCFSYFRFRKKLFPTPYKFYPNIEKTACFLTANEAKNAIKFIPNDALLINLDGFDIGINFFRDNDELEGITVNALNKIRNLIDKSPKMPFKIALNKVLNGNVMHIAQKENLPLTTIKLKAPATREAILEQMQPFKEPTREEIVNTIEITARKLTRNEEDYLTLRQNIADYYEGTLDIYTKQRIINALNIFSEKIKNYMSANNRPEESLHLLIPNKSSIKSYDVITQMFALKNNIPEEKIIRLDEIRELSTYPKDATFAVIDDLCASGNSLTTSAQYCIHGFEIKKSQRILFCPIVAHTEGLSKVKEVLEYAWRENIDAILTIEGNTKTRPMTPREVNRDNYFFLDSVGIKALGFEGYTGETQTSVECIVFPYMAPDNNPDLASFILKYFLPNNEAIRNKHLSFNEVEAELKNLKNVTKSSKD